MTQAEGPPPPCPDSNVEGLQLMFKIGNHFVKKSVGILVCMAFIHKKMPKQKFKISCLYVVLTTSHNIY